MTKERLYFIFIILIIAVFAIALSIQLSHSDNVRPVESDGYSLVNPLKEGQTAQVIKNIEILDDCVVSGCSKQICTDKLSVNTACQWHDTYACYDGGVCERQPDGECGWRRTTEIMECLTELIPELSE